MIIVVLTKFDFFKERDIDPKFGSFPWARDTKYPFEYFKINFDLSIFNIFLFFNLVAIYFILKKLRISITISYNH